jgi:hypothetical protein
MSLIKKSEVQNYLSTRKAGRLPFGLAPKAVTDAAAPLVIRKDGGVEGDRATPLHLIGAEPVANAQVGGSVGVPAGDPWQPRKL